MVSCDDIRREATEAEADRISQQHTLVATVSQLKDSSRDNSTAAAGPVRQRGAAQLKHAVKRNRDQTFIQHKLGPLPAHVLAVRCPVLTQRKILPGLIKNLRAQQGIELERLEAEEAEHTSLVDFAARSPPSPQLPHSRSHLPSSSKILDVQSRPSSSQEDATLDLT